MALAAAAAGADGLMIEVHNNPAKALCDGAQSLNPEEFAGYDFAYTKGQIVDAEKDVAVALIKAGYAEEIKSKESVKKDADG